MSAPLHSVLVANRGEIARRVFRTAREMGMRCVAVYVDADAAAPFVAEADEAIRLSGGYLDGPAIIAAALATGADAIHPGYGFLAENAVFAAAVADAGLAWVGPPPAVIDAMGDKLAAKRAAIDAGVPTLPSSDDPGADGDVGYPLLVKAAAGGGGKGMRTVNQSADLAEAVAAAQREAVGAFGDDRVFLERYMARARHIEIQILGDAHGGLVHLGERECSIQRRHQKIIEESPSSGIVDADLRAAMGDAALRLARALGYRSAGTVEFLVDDTTHEFFFLEVNTRLQVEHAVSEEVTGIDLVREQLRLAAGEPLGYGQEAITFRGHAIEARLYAEDPAVGFLPATGTLAAFAPAPEPEVRWDSGVEPGSVVGLDFDPMLAKVVAHAPTRTEAAGRLARALERLHLGGVTTNREFLAAALRHPAFLAGETTTDFIDRVDPAATLDLADDDLERVATLGALWVQGDNRSQASVLSTMPSGWRNARLPAQRITLSRGDRTITVRYRARRDGTFQLGDGDGRADGVDHRDAGSARVHRWTPTTIDAEIEGWRTTARVTRAGDHLYVQAPTGTVAFDVAPRFVVPGAAAATTGGLVAPMPGIVLDVRCAAGDVVDARQTLVVLEAMKMEHHVRAPADGVVADVRVAKGQHVENGAILLVLNPIDAGGRRMNGPIRIANCSGFYGDRLSAAREMVEGGPIDVLTGDWLAELTMLILARTQAKRAGEGYARSFVAQMEQVMGACMDRGIKVVSNAGGLDPPGCAEAVSEVADRLGLSPTVAYVEGDDLLPRLGELTAAGIDLAHLDTGEPVGDLSRFVSANAYLGCWGVVEALRRGADIVVTGRTTDAAVVCGPAAWHHGWARDDWDALAGAVVAGHVIECGTQATGGNYSFFTEVQGMTRVGFPWAEIAADGSSVIGKHDGTGGEVSVGTVTSQLLYEIAGPSYLGPDVTARFDTARLEPAGLDRVRVHGVRGEPPPPTLKVAMNELGGYRNDIAVALTGLDIEAKAQLVEDAFWEACPYKPEDFVGVTTRVVRTDKADPATNEEAIAAWRLTVKDPDERKVGRAVSSAMVELGLATIPGFFGLSGGPREARPYGVFRPALVPAELVPQHVVVMTTRERTVVDSTAPPAAETVAVAPAPGPAASAPDGPTVRASLGRVVGARSGDKAGNANLGVFARTDESWAWLDEFLTVDRLHELLPETADLAVDRYRLANLRALNFVIHGLLQEGVAASTRQDGQAKSLGEWLRARVVDLPAVLLPDAS